MPITASLSAKVESLWLSCHALNNEMVLTCPGRRIFPTLEYSLIGLEPTKRYSMCMHLELADDKKLRHVDGAYVESISIEKKDPPRKVWHNHGSQPGSFWMQKEVNFDQIRITNKKSVEDKSPSFVHLHAQHRYIPVLSIYSEDQKIHEVRLPHTLFIAVTSYHNTEIGTLKTNSNPYATGSRVDRRRKRELDSPAPAAKKVKKEATRNESALISNALPGMPSFNPFATMTVSDSPKSANTSTYPTPPTNPFFPMMPFFNPFMFQAMGFPIQLPNFTDCFPTPSPSISPLSAPLSPNNFFAKNEPEEEIEVV